MHRIDLPDEQATHDLGKRLADASARGDMFLLYGDLGAGKTSLARGFIQAQLGQGADVPSPTFNLAIPYEMPHMTITHFDLYRLSGPDDVAELGLEDALDLGVALIEWPERLHPQDQAQGIQVHIQDGTPRVATLVAPQNFMSRFHAA